MKFKTDKKAVVKGIFFVKKQLLALLSGLNLRTFRGNRPRKLSMTKTSLLSGYSSLKLGSAALARTISKNDNL